MTAEDASFEPWMETDDLPDEAGPAQIADWPGVIEVASPDGDIESRLAAGPTVVPILPLKDTVVFPDTMVPLAVGQPRSVRLIDDVLRGDKLVGLVTSLDPEIEAPGPDDVRTVGVLASIQKMLKAPDGTLRIITQGIRRIKVDRFVSEEPYLVAEVVDLPDITEESTEVAALQRNLVAVYTKIIELVPYLPDELEMAAANIDDPGSLGYFIASTMRLKTEEKQELLEEVEVSKRLRRLTSLMNRELEVLELGSKIQNQVQSEMGKTQREYFLRQQLKAIQDELGETDETQAEVNELREQLDKAGVAGGSRQAGEARARPALQVANSGGRIRRHPDLSGLDRVAPLEREHRRQPGHRPRQRSAGRGPLRSQGRERPHPRVPCRAEAQERGHRPHPLLQRPSRCGQDQPGQEHRPSVGAEVHPHQRGRSAGRIGDSRSPADVCGRHAGHHHTGHPGRGQHQPGLHDRRDRQDGGRLARGPV